MFRLSLKLILFPKKKTLLGSFKQSELINNYCRSIVRMNERWPILEKRKVEDGTDIDPKKLRIKKKMYAILLAYCGQGYLGLQRNHGMKTIEEDLMVALKKIDVVNDEEFRKQQLVNFQRAARTDKGVSAIRQVINLSMREGVKPEDLNQHLPEQIRVLAVKRVTKGFNSKNSCDSRTYSYTCPSFAFAPKGIEPSEEYRIDDEILEKLDIYSKMFVGTHNFYNFTSGRKPFDPSCKRHIIDAEWRKPVMSDGLELIMFIVKGQSFMLHQIRKMVGTLMAVCRGHVDPNYITKAFDPQESAHLPTAPGLGLLLEQVHYDWYNRKYGENGFHERLDFVDVEQQVEEFRIKQIFPVIIKVEKEEKSMLNYLKTLDSHYEDNTSTETLKEELAEQINPSESSNAVEHTLSKPVDDSSSCIKENMTSVSSL